MILSILNDISTVRALVEMYVDELRNNGDISANSLGEISKRLFFSFKGDKIAFFQNFVNTVLAWYSFGVSDIFGHKLRADLNSGTQ